MKSTVFVRPNLKVFIFGALALLIIQHLIINAHSQAKPGKPLVLQAREISDRDLEELIRYASEQPSAQLFLRISHCLEKRGDYRRALQYMRRAEKMSSMENSE